MTMTWQRESEGCAASCASEQGSVRILDWVESQSRVTRIWMDQLIAEGDPNDLVSVIHKRAAWLDLMHQRLKTAP